MKNRLNLAMLFLIMLFVSVAFLSKTSAQNENAGKTKDEINKEETKKYIDKVRKHLDERYPKSSINSGRKIESNLDIANNKGSLIIEGEDIKPNTNNVGHVAKEHNKARTIALAFFLENANELFNITDLNNIREFNVSASSHRGHTFTHLYFCQYIENIKVDNSDIQMVIEDESNISLVTAGFALVTPELHKAAKSKTLSEGDIRKIVKNDLQQDASSPDTPGYVVERIGKYPMFNKMEKLVTPESPYVIWKVESIYDYWIDAFTGKILKKLPTVIMGRRRGGVK